MRRKLRTKFVVSLGPASASEEVVEGLMRAGAYIFRCNFAHTRYQEYIERQAMIKRLNEKLGTNVLMQADIQGPHIRIGNISEDGIFVKERHTYVFVPQGEEREETDIPIDDDMIQQYIQPGQPISFLNGAIEGEVIAVEGKRVSVKMINSGTLRSHKAINLPETMLASCLTEKDRKDIAFLLDQGVDWLALSFVSKASEIEEVRAMIGDRPIKIMSKIERRSAVENLSEIIETSDAVMVARGDLGVELPMEDVPFIQKDILALANHAEKPVVVATQMLLSMTHSLRPTRAEVADVAEAVCERADAVMLSEESTEGIDPVNALSTMVRIAERAESYMYKEPNFFEKYSNAE